LIKSIINNHLISNSNFKSIDSVHHNISSLSEQNTFTGILSDYLSEIGIAKTTEDESNILNPEQISFLIRKVQLQMNQRLLNAILNNEEIIKYSPGINIYGHNLETKVSMPNASINRQEPPKNVVNNEKSDLGPIVSKAARKYQIDPDLIRSVIKTESNFDSNATSPKGAMGLMQLMPETARDLGVKNPYDAEENVMGGTKYLKMLLDRYKGDVDLALAAYNWGMGNLEKKPDSLPAETVTYIARVNNFYKNLKA
jgi:soluble lytic murein transglycosylase-like protein